MTIDILFFGTPEFSAHVLQQLISDERYRVIGVVTQPDKRAGRGRKLTPPSVKVVAAKNSIPTLQPGRIKKDKQGFLKEMEKFGKSTINVVCAFGQILPIEVLHASSSGVSVNTHASLLPRWRGAAPIQRAIMSGDKKTGVCLMEMDEGLDTGAVYSKGEIEITSAETAGSLHDKLAGLSGELLVRDLADIASGSRKARPQTEQGITYAKKITAGEAAIPWQKSATEVSNHIRGLSPFPGAYSTFRNKRLKIFFAESRRLFQGTEILSPGQISTVDKQSISIQCGDGVVKIDRLQIEGKRMVAARDFIAGHRPEVKEQLQ